MPIFIYMLVPFFEAWSYAMIFLFLVVGSFILFVYAVHGSEWMERLHEYKLKRGKKLQAGLWGAYGTTTVETIETPKPIR